MEPRSPHILAGYAVALAATLAALAVRLALNPWLAGSTPFLLFAPAVMVSAWYGGTGPGVAATVAGAALGDYFLLKPVGFSHSLDHLLRPAVFLAVGTQISWLSGALHRARARAEQARGQLEVRVAERTAELRYQKVLRESLIEASVDGILVISHDGRVAYANNRFVELWRVEPRGPLDTLGRVTTRMREKLSEGQDPLAGGDGAADAAPSPAPSHSHSHSHSPSTAPSPPHDGPMRPCPDEGPRAELLLKDGRTLECYSAPVVADDGTTYGKVWFFRDITERKRLEREVLDVCEREQRRIGRDLHDGLGQHLTGIALICKGLERRLGQKAPDEVPAVSEVAGLIGQAIAQARDLARGLRPLGLSSDALAGALQELGGAVQRASGVPVDFAVEQGTPAPGDSAATHLYRIAQEALHNAVRHGAPRSIRVSLAKWDGGLRLTVRDDGNGLPDPPDRGRGMGLQIMQHRARVAGATVEFRRGAGGGTVVDVLVGQAARGGSDEQ